MSAGWKSWTAQYFHAKKPYNERYINDPRRRHHCLVFIPEAAADCATATTGTAAASHNRNTSAATQQ
jgi:hypothetical protein